jgi:hypothetical protein
VSQVLIVLLNVIMMNVVMLSVIILSAVAPHSMLERLVFVGLTRILPKEGDTVKCPDLVMSNLTRKYVTRRNYKNMAQKGFITITPESG